MESIVVLGCVMAGVLVVCTLVAVPEHRRGPRKVCRDSSSDAVVAYAAVGASVSSASSSCSSGTGC